MGYSKESLNKKNIWPKSVMKLEDFTEIELCERVLVKLIVSTFF
jgi:hypothetical protein